MNPNDEDISDELVAALRAGSLHLWNDAAIFLSLFYLTGTVLKSLVIAGVVLISSFLGFGSRRLIQAGFALAVVAVLVSYGFPHPKEWLAIAKAAPTTINFAWSHPQN